MALLSEVKYETGIRINELEDVSSEVVLTMLNDVRANIGKLEGTFANADLARVLKVVEDGMYEVNGSVSTRIDLSAAKNVVDIYRKYSEGGCQSCVDLGREVTDPQDARSGFFCRVSDPHYDEKEARMGRIGCHYEGHSPKVRKHYDLPCDSWAPKVSPPLKELIESKK